LLLAFAWVIRRLLCYTRNHVIVDDIIFLKAVLLWDIIKQCIKFIFIYDYQ
jgi:hypothetical protein